MPSVTTVGQETTRGAVPLTALRRGESGVISRVDPGLDAQVQRRLRLLGFCEGREVSYVRRAFWAGPRIFRICDVQMCIRAEQAAMIHVTPAA
ncbi:FeoA family protein [uncultured Propionibacterium sp.]|uniref:FeoA family protein n=1 Tax=uncultured Propionibacterium sp. TaxID=218066 RepID=UPI002930A154|nr:FeoA family protein [uncultured Propionibacterium sp.]